MEDHLLVVKMKKILIIMFGIVLLAGLVISFGQINKTITFDKNTKDNLDEIGITNPIISSCVEITNLTCKATIFQKGGINKQIEIETIFCESYVAKEIEGMFSFSEGENPKIMVCDSWKTLTQTEIETEIEKKTEELLKSISSVHDNRKQSKEILTDEILITINGK